MLRLVTVKLIYVTKKVKKHSFGDQHTNMHCSLNPSWLWNASNKTIHDWHHK